MPYRNEKTSRGIMKYVQNISKSFGVNESEALRVANRMRSREQCLVRKNGRIPEGSFMEEE
ncbi:hypothetical protein D3Z53_16495 [Lachnospiraceae bacterium]|jgi:hypothetical protein|nr:hypothetical protein C808_04127 [Lachnospiraceae bacterium M18-1]NBI59612.1 hypothetical protein [Lachnospiraceae bacterium]